jgi:hypothetical protein
MCLSYKGNFRFVERHLSSEEVGQHYSVNESSICSILLSSMNPDHSPFFLSSGLPESKLTDMG